MTEAQRIVQLEASLRDERAARVKAEEVAERITAVLSAKQRDAELIQRITAAANLAPQLSHVLQAMVDLVCEYTGWPVGHVFAADGENLRTLGIWHLSAIPMRHARLPRSRPRRRRCASASACRVG